MDIAVHCDVNAGVAEDLAQAFDIEAELNAACGETVAAGVEARRRNPTDTKRGFKAVFEAARLYVCLRAGQHKAGVICLDLPKHVRNDLGQGNGTQ